ncbi:NUDIX hydrolase [Thermodesulfobacterium hydrogeniphilum]|uniref:NUDIX hydrolase n=1 Tax=Thermodesulfobacterium hydrogeniphilum TaxID=161156 RepID=UPI00068CD5AD|nr:NUDIX domain-containing protein [Thermodesulfobacterium hydrogeniphilum]
MNKKKKDSQKKGRKKKETPESRKRELLEAVDENCNPITILNREEIHNKGYFHKTVHIFLFNKNREIYLQKKSQIVEENPGLWTSSASGHVLVGESFLITAQRELKEELSIKVKLEEVFKINPTESPTRECIALFVGYTNKIPKPNPLEIEEGRFFLVEEVDKLIQTSPEIFSPSFKFLWKKYWSLVTQTELKGK